MTAKTDQKWTTRYPELGTDPIPIEPCLSPHYFEHERERIFRRVWLNIGREEEIPHKGDYFIKELAVCPSSILVVRGKDDVIRAFFNMCSHRGNKVVRACTGRAGGFVCGFHGWKYDLLGNLLQVPDEEQFFEFEREKHGLTPIAVDLWNGFIFINLDPQPAETLGEYLDELGEGLIGYPFEKMNLVGTYRAEVKANWKVTLDSFQEGYHVAFLHKRSAGRAYADQKNPVIHALAFRLFKLHRMMSIPGAASYRPTPVEMIAHRFGSSITKVEEGRGSIHSLPPSLNPTKSSSWVFDMIVFFPNFFLFLFDGTYFTYNFWPLAVDRTLWETRTYYPPAENAGQRFSQEYAKCALRDTLREDGNTLEAIYRNMASRAKTHFVLQDQEILIRHSHKVVAEMVRS
ncbi:MAG TPA: aromatic ring-hydroxylating dioxygenase subunit alpha [Pyrinomonadaceae bacterium]|nr:aromatic ring-hydroxylating dioxygenase subunit alpha [Pyrinomonadaceae bacterium]